MMAKERVGVNAAAVVSGAGQAVVIGLLVSMFFFLEREHSFIEERIDVLEGLVVQAVEDEVSRATGEYLRAIGDLEASLADVITLSGSAGTAATAGRIASTNTRLERLEGVYADLLAEQKKKTVESLYSDRDLAGRYGEGLRLLEQGKYSQAYGVFSLVSGEQPENMDARFYMYYALFERNRHDREQYKKIREGLTLLQRNGYTREEIGAVLDFMAAEELGKLAGEAR
ncbi:hypothetical protein [Breznakiella homolactica]|uniref:Tetratricopeptide repeat protein n=1 Tax=Breznakiella homolactica TaxID=2798577 RepID=A0A7T7XR88_9SPIR|nr:hypothetical protein [Breznakiella homolactica]QQO11003.1 hypothetical protein JFL75_08820 [Breznakiella homolactica]